MLALPPASYHLPCSLSPCQVLYLGMWVLGLGSWDYMSLQAKHEHQPIQHPDEATMLAEQWASICSQAQVRRVGACG